MVDQGGAIHSCPCSAPIAVGRTAVGLGRLNDRKFRGRFGGPSFTAAAAQNGKRKNTQKKAGRGREIDSFQWNLFGLFQVYLSNE